MTKGVHRTYIFTLAAIVATALIIIIIYGTSYYITPIEERVHRSDHILYKPSGEIGHGIGIFGSFFMIIGMASYMARKRFRFLSRLGVLKHWLEFHIFLCTLGPMLILFHTAFKFGGIVAVSFWSMVAVFLSGIAGRFIYLQIPRSREGKELSLSELRGLRGDITTTIRGMYELDDESYKMIGESVKRKPGIYQSNLFLRLFKSLREQRKSVNEIRRVLIRAGLPSKEIKKVIRLVKNEIRLNRKIEQLDQMQNLFRYWHVIHLPFALVMLIIMVIHIGVTILFGYRWIL
jgi:hypothetical protein